MNSEAAAHRFHSSASEPKELDHENLMSGSGASGKKEVAVCEMLLHDTQPKAKHLSYWADVANKLNH